MKKRLHRVVVTLMFDEPCTSAEALRVARKCIVGADSGSSIGFTITSATWLSKLGAREFNEARRP